MRTRSLLPLAVAAALLLAGCSPALDRASVERRWDQLVADVRSVPDVLDAVVKYAEPEDNAAPMFVRLDYDAGEERLTDAMVAVRARMAASDFALFSIDFGIDDPQELSWGAELRLGGLPKESEIRDEAAIWFDMISSTPLRGFSYLAHHSDIGNEVIITPSPAVRPDGTVASESEVDEALIAVWVAAGRDSDELGIIWPL